ncbi:hypothetical protein ABT095_06895 [Kitasatospora sp. NPDC002227]|uniref:hypothetical protein n=1 Tax=Kitasatospora sp. NPDC002227 TaxID=3154773 RepID=UPI00331DF1F2
MNGPEENETVVGRQARGRRRRRLTGCAVLVAVAATAVAVLLGTETSRSARESERARADADAQAARFGRSVAALDYTRGIPTAEVDRAAATVGIEVLAVTPGAGGTADFRIRVRVPVAAPPAPMSGSLTRCYTLRAGPSGTTPAAPRQSDCGPAG